MNLDTLARAMMDDVAVNNHDDEWSNRLSQVANKLLTVGQPFGPRRFRDLDKADQWVAAYAARAYGMLPNA
jgi:hypothetical protein